MGCGVVCGLQPKIVNYTRYSKRNIEQLFPYLKISKPFLSQKRYHHFIETFKNNHQNYILKVNDVVGLEENVQEAIMQKWKFLLYGLDKGDEIYKRCLSFQVRSEKQNVTNDYKAIKNNSSLINTSYHEIKRDPQYHECFQQIEKDLNRTFEFKMQKKQIFENVLKRISNYFPSMGYTQGVNFIVGYLLVLGYSQSDTFWMFIHLAINKRYLILGMYEDGFPLTYIYTLIFKNILKRKDPQLYNHFFNNLMLDQSMWIFKWLITYYIYSFPFSLIKYIWNLVIEIGGFALVYFAVSLILNLRSLLLSIHDQCDMSEFLQKLRDINIFNKLIKINHVIEYAYQLTVISQDFEGLNQLKPSFYKQYYKIVSEKLKQSQKLKVKEQDEEIKPVIKLNKKQEDILHNWYGKLLVQRMQFQKKQESQKLTERSIRLPENMKNQYEDLQKSLKFLQEKVIKNQQIKLSSKLIKDSERKNDFFDDLLYEESYEIQANPQKENLVPVLDAIKKCSTKFSHIDVEINQVQQFSDSNNQQIQQIQQNLQNMKQQESYFNDDIAQRNPNQYQLKIQTKYQTKINTLVGQQANSIKKYNNKELTEKANNIKPYIEEKKKGLCIVGQNILNNLSIAQSQHSSSLSSNNNFKPKKQKQNIIRQKIIKTKTQQKSQHSISPSQYESSIDGQTQKQVFSRVVKRQVANTQTQFDSTNIKYNNQTEREFTKNSHVHRIQQVLHENSLNNPCENNQTQIEIFNGNNLFKKKNKIHFRNSNNISISNNLNDHVQGLSENRNACSRKLQVNNYKEKFTDEQSLQYIIYPLSNRKKSGKKHLAQSCEIQSIQAQIKNF